MFFNRKDRSTAGHVVAQEDLVAPQLLDDKFHVLGALTSVETRKNVRALVEATEICETNRL